MSARLTVVFDDEALYRDVKVFAAENGMAVKAVVEAALRRYLANPSAGEPKEIVWDWDAYDEWQREVDAMILKNGVTPPTDLSDIKHHLYGAPPQRALAEANLRARE